MCRRTAVFFLVFLNIIGSVPLFAQFTPLNASQIESFNSALDTDPWFSQHFSTFVSRLYEGKSDIGPRKLLISGNRAVQLFYEGAWPQSNREVFEHGYGDIHGFIFSVDPNPRVTNEREKDLFNLFDQTQMGLLFAPMRIYSESYEPLFGIQITISNPHNAKEGVVVSNVSVSEGFQTLLERKPVTAELVERAIHASHEMLETYWRVAPDDEVARDKQKFGKSLENADLFQMALSLIQLESLGIPIGELKARLKRLEQEFVKQGVKDFSAELTALSTKISRSIPNRSAFFQTLKKLELPGVGVSEIKHRDVYPPIFGSEITPLNFIELGDSQAVELNFSGTVGDSIANLQELGVSSNRILFYRAYDEFDSKMVVAGEPYCYHPQAVRFGGIDLGIPVGFLVTPSPLYLTKGSGPLIAVKLKASAEIGVDKQVSFHKLDDQKTVVAVINTPDAIEEITSDVTAEMLGSHPIEHLNSDTRAFGLRLLREMNTHVSTHELSEVVRQTRANPLIAMGVAESANLLGFNVLREVDGVEVWLNQLLNHPERLTPLDIGDLLRFHASLPSDETPEQYVRQLLTNTIGDNRLSKHMQGMQGVSELLVGLFQHALHLMNNPPSATKHLKDLVPGLHKNAGLIAESFLLVPPVKENPFPLGQLLVLERGSIGLAHSLLKQVDHIISICSKGVSHPQARAYNQALSAFGEEVTKARTVILEAFSKHLLLAAILIEDQIKRDFNGAMENLTTHLLLSSPGSLMIPKGAIPHLPLYGLFKAIQALASISVDDRRESITVFDFMGHVLKLANPYESSLNAAPEVETSSFVNIANIIKTMRLAKLLVNGIWSGDTVKEASQLQKLPTEVQDQIARMFVHYFLHRWSAFPTNQGKSILNYFEENGVEGLDAHPAISQSGDYFKSAVRRETQVRFEHLNPPCWEKLANYLGEVNP